MLNNNKMLDFVVISCKDVFGFFAVTSSLSIKWLFLEHPEREGVVQSFK